MLSTNQDQDQQSGRSEAELRQSQKQKTSKERALRFTKDRNKGESRIKAVGIKEADDTLVADDEYGIINLRRIKSLKDLQ